MTPATAAALADNVDQLYGCFDGYRERLAKEPKGQEDQAVFQQLFAQDIRQVSLERLTALVGLLRLPKHRFGTLELKLLLPRLCEISLEPKPALPFPVIAELLGLFHFEQWPTSERTVVWDYCLLFFRSLLEEFSGRAAPPWGAYGFFRELSKATTHVQPALLSWEMADFVTADLHLATFATNWVEDRPLREQKAWGTEQLDTIERWLQTAGRAKLSRAVSVHSDAPFRSEFEAALARLG